MKIRTFRLRPGSNLRSSIEKYVRENKFKAGIIISVIGGLKSIKLRMAGATPAKQIIRHFKENLEIVSAEGTISKDGGHIHISVANKKGTVVGGHLKEGVVAFTAEISLIELEDRRFLRQLDKETGFKELVIKY
ncbi:MAG: hypothetical protein A2Z11_02155 [Candidatus Woykebacteria bacterium RBG_16_43_9]|uniref:PPC domain-containing protein n=1 Tax=Candidatus Woykebacteria bacterium RBG_16_43_9 TaxID=1802596 RepID=A0A1G1WGD3_9BACT|nr:MAG: hypothetical protein A2Z11_02155 [Candidatus Woykebacteria bacterium RBG_16_43_9]